MIVELFSERKRKASNNAVMDVYQYEDAPKKLRVQLQQILADAIGGYYVPGRYDYSTPPNNNLVWDNIHKILCRELGIHQLTGDHSAADQVIGFIGTCSLDNLVDAMEIAARCIERVIGGWNEVALAQKGIRQAPSSAIDEINYRFRQAGVGYQFIDGQAIRVDSEFVHEEVVKPALRILNRAGCEGARDEFLSAHRHYRNGDYEEAITEAAKAFESTLKIVCEQRRWAYPSGARATDLLKIIRANGLWPNYLDNSFDQLVATLASGLPKVRNEQGAHGQGALLRSTPSFVAAYALHLAAAKIVFVAEAAV